jgi:predicted DNA-binding protein (UPF0251 family)
VDARRRARRRTARETARAIPAGSSAPADDRTELHEALRVELAKLLADEREAVALVFFEGLTRKDAAAGVHRDTFAKLLDGALAKLRAALSAVAVAGAAGTAATVEAALSSRQAVAPGRLAELVSKACAAPAARAAGWAKAGAAGLVLLGGGLAVGGWARTREQPDPPHQVTTTPPSAPAEARESVPDRNRRVFQTEVLPRQLAALRPLALGEGTVEVQAFNAYDTRLECSFLLRHQVPGADGWVSKLAFVHNTSDHGTSVYFALKHPGETRSLDTKRPVILWRNPLTAREAVLKVAAVEEARLAFSRLPQDDQTAAERRDHLRRVERAIPSFLGTWYARGQISRVRAVSVGDHGWLYVECGPDVRTGVPLGDLRVGAPGELAGLPYTSGPVEVSADGKTVRFRDSDEWWSREPVAEPGK